MATNYKYFIIAEMLAVAAYIPNAANVLIALEGHGPTSAAWEIRFGLFYWLKTALSVVGLIFLRKANTKPKTKKAILFKFVVVLTILYSIPFTNMSLATITGVFYKIVTQFPRPPSHFEYFDRIPIIIAWLIPTSLILCDLIRRLGLLLLKRNQC